MLVAIVKRVMYGVTCRKSARLRNRINRYTGYSHNYYNTN